MWIDGRNPPSEELAGNAIGGVALGVLSIDSAYPLFPGNVMNASTFDFPIHYRILPGVDFKMVAAADERVATALIEKGRELVGLGCSAILGSCGSFANFQSVVAAALPVPVFMSVMICAPLLARSVAPGGQVGILCGSRQAMTKRVLDQMGIDEGPAYVFQEALGLPEFKRILSNDPGLRGAALQSQVTALARDMVAANPAIRLIILQCNDLSPYAWAIQDATGLPVFDATALVEWVQYACVRRPHSGPLGRSRAAAIS